MTSTNTVQLIRDDLEYRPPYQNINPENFNLEQLILAGAIIREIDDGRPRNPAEFSIDPNQFDKYPFNRPAFDNARFDLRNIKYLFPTVPPKFIDDNGDLDRTRITIQQVAITSRTITNSSDTPIEQTIQTSFTAEEQRAYTQTYGWKVGANVGLTGKVPVPKIAGSEIGGSVGLDFSYSSEVTDNKEEKTSRTEQYTKNFQIPPRKTYRIIAISETGHFQTKFEPVMITGNIAITKETAERWRDTGQKVAEFFSGGLHIPSNARTLATNITKNYTIGDIAFNLDRHTRLDLTLQKFRPQTDWSYGADALFIPGRSATEYYDNPNLRLKVSTDEGLKMQAATRFTTGIRSRKVVDTWAGSLKYDGMADGKLNSPLAYFDSGLHVKIISFSNVDERIIDLQSGILGDDGFFFLPNVEPDVLEDGTEVMLGMEGTSEDDLMRGDQEDNYFAGENGNDSIEAETGNDLIFGGNGNDSLYGGDGNDLIQGDDGDDLIQGDDGNDNLYGAEGNNVVEGGDGDDFIRGGDDDDILDGQGENDVIEGVEGNDFINGGDGDDILDGGAGNDSIYGDEGNDYITVTEGNNYLDGGTGDDVILAGSGNDTILGGEGNDLIDGGNGDDVLMGVSGENILRGGEGNDTIYGGSGKDEIYGGAGNDVIVLQNVWSGFDRFLGGGEGFDTIRLVNPSSTVWDLTEDTFIRENIEQIDLSESNIQLKLGVPNILNSVGFVGADNSLERITGNELSNVTLYGSQWQKSENSIDIGDQTFFSYLHPSISESLLIESEINVNFENTEPVAFDDIALYSQGESINVLENDGDVDIDTLSVQEVTNGQYGTVSINDDGTIRYTANDDFNFDRADSFTYTVSDGIDTSTATVNMYLKAPEEPEISSIYRFRNNDGGYLYTGIEERQVVLENFPNFTEEGIAFSMVMEYEDYLNPIYRFQNLNHLGSYLYVGEQERDSILQNYPNFREEGIAFYTFDSVANVSESIYRFQNADLPGTYIYVGSEERENILENYPNFREEGIAFQSLPFSSL
ncbi:Ig-like domain-containing protein [Geminocystis sp. NIES-3709]|uniref:Ig-like domain-containing protein n=1 Tax=Geminocystis sp. NIES-3709 TaxID=1617448 RepID=UPI0005FC6E7A|nr:Ig-like domain-containing protein [Geminocystis sp. NIES-3709]BAQ63283.1 alkaline phosphatase [Geminocystis sp. NIES-3709]